jgi:adenylate cyclase
VAERVGVSVDFVDRLVELGILKPGDGLAPFSLGDVRRAHMMYGLQAGGLPLDGIGTAVRNGDLSFAFMDLPSWDWYGGFLAKTYRVLSEETGLSLEMLQAVREAMGFARPSPDDLVREKELDFVPVLQIVLDAAADPASVERLVRVWGDSMRRITEAAATFYHAQIEVPLLQAGMNESQVLQAANEAVAAGIAYIDQSLVSLYHAHSERTWTGNVVEAVEATLEKAGLYRTAARPPAMCFLDLSGYTRLTEERGDQAAAEMAATLGGVVQRSAQNHAGRPVKWLGDGVMLYFPEPGSAVTCALDLAEAVPAAGLPQTHTGIDAGPVVFQDGDYFGRTVVTASRISGYAGPGQVLVSDSVVRSTDGSAVRFVDVGRVSLAGLPSPIALHEAHRAG